MEFTNFEKIEEKPHYYTMSVLETNGSKYVMSGTIDFEWTPLPKDTWAHEVFLNYYKFLKMAKEYYAKNELEWNPEIHVDYYDEMFDRMESYEIGSNPARYQQIMAEIDGKEVSHE